MDYAKMYIIILSKENVGQSQKSETIYLADIKFLFQTNSKVKR
jgi:hypothetical protein